MEEEAAAAAGVLAGAQEMIRHHLIPEQSPINLSKDGRLVFGVGLLEERRLVTWLEIETIGGTTGMLLGDGVPGRRVHSLTLPALVRALAPLAMRAQASAQQVADSHLFVFSQYYVYTCATKYKALGHSKHKISKAHQTIGQNCAKPAASLLSNPARSS